MSVHQAKFPARLAKNLNPLIITSAVPRSGTTLLQRLLCSSNQALIYGEKCAHDLEFFLNIYAYKMQEYQFQREMSQRDLEKVLHGEVNDWILNLTPDIDGYLSAMQTAAFAGIEFCQKYAQSVGRQTWGFKYPGWTPNFVQLLMEYLPQARIIFLYRDLNACLKSAKAQYLVTNDQEVREFCQKWLIGLNFLRNQTSQSAILGVNFEALIDKPGDTLKTIAEFSDVHDMDTAVLSHKINIWPGQNYSSQTKDGYIEPVELNQMELSIVNEFTGAAHLV